MRNFSNNMYIDALLKLMLISAALHLVILGVYALMTKDISVFNYFYIINLQYIYPKINLYGVYISITFAAIIYAALLLHSKKSNAK